ncbi:HU family DNA-binding protein [Sulfitobacter sp. F26169L]|uniref:HU family DNA-binding protein n=1 Tax=Sulfitobacter sp. F26169L TaxID=2996015 RepID=UPI002260BE03|nr:HU family DNA-binding protein [Sulfitobacter sp. F26169L]MCX7565257.1 HU family DNA-binding protein [Sulfitobacter sp. F26169L]
MQPAVVDTLSPVVVSNELRKKELFDLVVERSGMKKKDVKPVVEAMLAVLGDALAEQREMNLQPLGKMKVQRGKELADGRALVLKLRQKSAKLNATPDTPESNPSILPAAE